MIARSHDHEWKLQFPWSHGTGISKELRLNPGIFQGFHNVMFINTDMHGSLLLCYEHCRMNGFIPVRMKYGIYSKELTAYIEAFLTVQCECYVRQWALKLLIVSRMKFRKTGGAAKFRWKIKVFN